MILSKRILQAAAALFFIAAAVSCNKDDVIIDDDDKPQVTVPDLDDIDDDAAVLFMPLSYFQRASVRYTFAGRKVVLRPIVKGYANPSYSWSLDGKETGERGEYFSFIPEDPGSYTVEVTVKENGRSYKAAIIIAAVNHAEAEGFRDNAGAAGLKVLEYVPGPGQFINENMDGMEASLSTANTWARERLETGKLVSLGSFGGYLIAGFDHSIVAGNGKYDFIIEGNAFNSQAGSSNEPGIVWVMQDVNGNGLPDDEWFELRGSGAENADTKADFGITYMRPETEQANIAWETIDGATGTVDYNLAFHSQPTYFPAWIDAGQYTLYGTCLPYYGYKDPDTRQWELPSFDWGYADNAGDDNLGSGYGESNNSVGFKISNAVYCDGTPVNLMYIDFVKVQTGVLGQCGHLGEVSTEISSIHE